MDNENENLATAAPVPPEENAAAGVIAAKGESELVHAYLIKERELNEAKELIADLIGKLDAARAAANLEPNYDKLLTDERLIDRAVKDAVIRERVLTEYLGSLASGGAVNVLSSALGRTPLTPVRKPTTLGEAKRIAENMIQG